MPKSKHRRNGKNRTASKRRAGATSTPTKHPYYNQPCPLEDLINEFGEEGAEWLVAEYERPLNRADLELEKCIRAGTFTMDHPDDGPTVYTLAELSASTWMMSQIIIEMARREGVMTAAELEETEHDIEIDHEEDGPDIIRNSHWADGLLLNQRGMWDFGDWS